MPIDTKTDLELYYAVVNEDGTYGEPMPIEGCKTIKIEWLLSTDEELIEWLLSTGEEL